MRDAVNHLDMLGNQRLYLFHGERHGRNAFSSRIHRHDLVALECNFTGKLDYVRSFGVLENRRLVADHDSSFPKTSSEGGHGRDHAHDYKA